MFGPLGGSKKRIPFKNEPKTVDSSRLALLPSFLGANVVILGTSF